MPTLPISPIQIDEVEDRLPNTLHELLRVAIDDLKKCMAKPEKFQIDMGIWVDGGRSSKICFVCLAGAALVQTCQADYASRFLDIDDAIAANPTLARKLRAINALRSGHVKAAWHMLNTRHRWSPDGHYPDVAPVYRPVAWFDSNPERFVAEMEDLYQILKEAGI